MVPGWYISVPAGETMTDIIQKREDPDANERRFVRKCKKWHLELLKEREQFVPPCVMYERPG